VIALASKFDCKVTLVKVFETPHVYQSAASQGILMDIHEAAVREASDYLEGVKTKLEAEGLSVEIDFIEGENVPLMLLEAIEESDADLVVMSTHGRSGLDRWRFGSVAQRVARHSTIPVVLVQPKIAS
jgi:nucleotide-binding universal stress UspA family protein